jgi:2-polyprenyl-6-methoxyphenol hydroxylase-like FAD-dependent oxidoreductase
MLVSTSSPTGQAVIVGAGIGGLACAVALHKRGWTATVLEQADRLAPVGSGISLFPNALRALDVLGLGAPIRAAGQTDIGVGIRSPSGRWLSRTDPGAIAQRYGPTVLVHRADLIRLLRDALPAGAVVTGTRVAGGAITTIGGSQPAALTYAGSTVAADVLIAADGVHSMLRLEIENLAGVHAGAVVVEGLEEHAAGPVHSPPPVTVLDADAVRAPTCHRCPSCSRGTVRSPDTRREPARRLPARRPARTP